MTPSRILSLTTTIRVKPSLPRRMSEVNGVRWSFKNETFICEETRVTRRRLPQKNRDSKVIKLTFSQENK